MTTLALMAISKAAMMLECKGRNNIDNELATFLESHVCCSNMTLKGNCNVSDTMVLYVKHRPSNKGMFTMSFYLTDPFKAIASGSIFSGL